MGQLLERELWVQHWLTEPCACYTIYWTILQRCSVLRLTLCAMPTQQPTQTHRPLQLQARAELMDTAAAPPLLVCSTRPDIDT